MPASKSPATRDLVVAAARAAVGTRFRPQGRTPGLALDCIGLALVAARAAGLQPGTTPAYALNGDNGPKLEGALEALGCRRVADPLPGDLVVAAPSPRQCHVAIVAPGGVIQAHAGMGKVVEGPIDPGWIIVSSWRFPGVH